MIEISHLTKLYGTQRAVDDINFSVEKGEIVGFLGPNGAGKTTTMKMITCYMPPSAGEVKVGGYSVEEDSLAIRRMIGYLPELNPLYLEMNVVDFLRYIAELRGIEKEKRSSRIREVIDLCALGEVLHKDIGQLSKGYRQRVGLAQAMIHDPEILILDEPTIGLDPNQVVDIRNLIKQLGREKTVILSTHILSEVQATCQRAVIISRGKIVADSSIADLQTSAAEQSIIDVELDGDIDKNAIVDELSTVEGVSDVKVIYMESRRNANEFKITSVPGADPRPEIFRKAVEKDWVLIGMSKEVRSLEEIFHKLTTQN